jgi:hypothetical protein
MTKSSPPSRQKLILKPHSLAQVSYGAGLGDIISEEEGHRRLAEYATEDVSTQLGEGEGGASDN